MAESPRNQARQPSEAGAPPADPIFETIQILEPEKPRGFRHQVSSKVKTSHWSSLFSCIAPQAPSSSADDAKDAEEQQDEQEQASPSAKWTWGTKKVRAEGEPPVLAVVVQPPTSARRIEPSDSWPTRHDCRMPLKIAARAPPPQTLACLRTSSPSTLCASLLAGTLRCPRCPPTPENPHLHRTDPPHHMAPSVTALSYPHQHHPNPKPHPFHPQALSAPPCPS